MEGEAKDDEKGCSLARFGRLHEMQPFQELQTGMQGT